MTASARFPRCAVMLLLLAGAGPAAAGAASAPLPRWTAASVPAVGSFYGVAAGPDDRSFAGGSVRPGAAGTPFQPVLCAYSSAGVLRWSRTAGGHGSSGWEEAIRGVAIAPTSGTMYDIVVAGSVTSSPAGDGTPDGWLARYDTNGTLLWEVFAAGPAGAGDTIEAVTVSAGGTIFVAGRQGVTALNTDAWFASYDPNGNKNCEAYFNGMPGQDDAGLAIALDAAGSIYVGGFKATATDGQDLWLARYEPQACNLTLFGGGAPWSLTISGGTGGPEWVKALAVLPGGDLVVLGGLTGPVTLTDIYIARMGTGTPYTEGQLLWSVSVDGQDYVSGYDDDLPGGLAYEPVNAVLYANGGLDTPPVTNLDFWAVRIDPVTSTTAWQVIRDVSGAHDVGTAIAANGSGYFWIAGYETPGFADPVPYLAQYGSKAIVFTSGGAAVVSAPVPHAEPNPFRPGSGGAQDAAMVSFTPLPAGAAVRVYTLAGGLVADLVDADGDGIVLWDGKNRDGVIAASALYIYVIRPPSGGVVRGKLAVIR